MPDRVDPAPTAMLRRVGGEAFLRELVSLFFENAPARLEAARRAWAANDSAALAFAAHSLRSSSGQLGAAELQRACERLESLAEGGKMTEAGAQLAHASTELVYATEWLGELIEPRRTENG